MLSRLRFIPLRLLQAVPVAFGVTLVVFFLVHLIPGDPAVSLLGARATPAKVAALRQQMGLNQPLAQQYWHFLTNLAHGDLGQSYRYHTSVLSLVLDRIPVTLMLVLYAVVLMLIISIPLSALAASKPGRVRDHAVRVIPLVGLGMPQFWVGIMLLLIFSVTLAVFPVGGYGESFYMCVDDLEDELIRSVGMDSIERVVESAGDLRSFRTFQGQPGWRGRSFDQQFHRFLGAGARRKIRYAGLLVQAMDLTRIPRPLESVMEHIRLRE